MGYVGLARTSNSFMTSEEPNYKVPLPSGETVHESLNTGSNTYQSLCFRRIYLLFHQRQAGLGLAMQTVQHIWPERSRLATRTNIPVDVLPLRHACSIGIHSERPQNCLYMCDVYGSRERVGPKFGPGTPEMAPNDLALELPTPRSTLSRHV